MTETAAARSGEAHPRLEDVDLADPFLYRDGDPHAVWRLLRREAPVFWNAQEDGPGFWALTRYDDALFVYRDPATFSSARGIILGPHRSTGDPAGGKMLALTDPPRHTKLRRVLNRAFAARAVARLEVEIRAVVAACLDEALAAGSCDFVETVAARIPVATICGLLGVPREDWELMFELTSIAFSAEDPDYRDDEADVRISAGIAHSEILAYYAELAERRRDEPGEDVVSALVHGVVDGVPLTIEEILVNCDNLVVGGNETARHAAAGAVVAFVEHPAEWRRVVDDPGLIPTAVEEILRWTTPGMHVLRTATSDVAIGATPIGAGDAITIWNASANRDGDAFDRPDEFDATRTPNRHLALGSGEHFCLGASLARLELRLLLEALVARVAAIELGGTPRRLASSVVGGFKSVPVRLVPG